MKKGLKGIIVGLAIAITFEKLLYIIALRIQPTPYSILVIAYLLPLFIGTILTGEIIGRNGWKYGLLVALVYMIYDIIEAIIHFGGIISLSYMLPNAWRLLTYSLIGCAGGYLGQRLAQK